jgi:hypothetical protein
MAYAHDWTKDHGNYNVGHRQGEGIVTLIRYIDTTATGYDLTSAEFDKIFAVPDNFCVLEARVICDVVEGAVETIDIVDDDSATTTFVSNADLSTAGGTVTTTNARKCYQAAGYICIRPDADITAAKFWVVIEGIILTTDM